MDKAKGIKKIKNYRFTRELGKGAVGVVYEVIDDSNQKKYAAKSMSTEKLNRNPDKEKEILASFKNELKVLRNLDHHNVIKIFGVEKTPNNIYLIIEYANGGNLYEYLKYYKKTYKAPLSEQSVQFMVRQMARGLEYLHKNNVTHRDIKLENILLHFPQVQGQVDYANVKIEEAIIKIADLGYAKDLKGDDLMTTICGTALNMAPDIIGNYGQYKQGSASKSYNTKVDLWSLGTITYELLFGTPPFFASNYNELFKQIMDGKYNMPKNVRLSIEAITFLNGLLQFYPDKRIGWNEINKHPFIINKVRDFHMIDMEQIDPEKKNTINLQLSSKDPNNFLWVLLKPKEEIGVKSSIHLELDKVDTNFLDNKQVLAEISTQPLENKDYNNNVDDHTCLDEAPVPTNTKNNTNADVAKINQDLPSKLFVKIDDVCDQPVDTVPKFELDEEWEIIDSESIYIADEETPEVVVSSIEPFELNINFFK